MKDFYRDVRWLGNVLVIEHAQKRLAGEGVSEQLFEKVLLTPIGKDIPDGFGVYLRERNGVRLVLVLMEPGFYLLKTGFRIKTLVSTLGCPRGRSQLMGYRR